MPQVVLAYSVSPACSRVYRIFAYLCITCMYCFPFVLQVGIAYKASGGKRYTSTMPADIPTLEAVEVGSRSHVAATSSWSLRSS